LGAENGLDNLLYASSKNGQPFRIIGVVEDFYYQGLHREIQPLIHFYSKYVEDQPAFISVRVKPGNISVILEKLKETWKSVPPAAELNYFFADEEITRQYEFVIQDRQSCGIIFSAGDDPFLPWIDGYDHVRYQPKDQGNRHSEGDSAHLLETYCRLFTIQYVKWIILSFALAAPAALYHHEQMAGKFCQQDHFKLVDPGSGGNNCNLYGNPDHFLAYLAAAALKIRWKYCGMNRKCCQFW
jgi:putative ABC transport system permease protein